MAITSESISAFAACVCVAISGYSLWRGISDNRNEKMGELENRQNHSESFLEFKYPENFKRWRK